jgi:hypothetical protein
MSQERVGPSTDASLKVNGGTNPFNRAEIRFPIRLTLVVVLGLLILVMVGTVVAGYVFDQQWTGVVARKEGRLVATKTLWDWLQLLAIPIVIAAVAALVGLRAESSPVVNCRA